MRAPIVLAHRGNLRGPNRAAENSVAAVAGALRRGWGVELDIRRAADGCFYVPHDPRPTADGALADDLFAILRGHPDATVALNVKELGYEEALVEYLHEQGVVSQSFLFDMELVEPCPGESARVFRRCDPSVRLAARVSDRGEPLDRALAIGAASIIWLDEFDDFWCTEADVRRLKDEGRTIYAVSPDLHGFPAADTRRRWVQFAEWGVDGICTDYAAALDCVLGEAEAAGRCGR